MAEKSEKMKIFCESCEAFHEALIDEMTIMPKAHNQDKPWGDICCANCHMVVLTIIVDEPGRYKFVKVS